MSSPKLLKKKQRQFQQMGRASLRKESCNKDQMKMKQGNLKDMKNGLKSILEKIDSRYQSRSMYNINDLLNDPQKSRAQRLKHNSLNINKIQNIDKQNMRDSGGDSDGLWAHQSYQTGQFYNSQHKRFRTFCQISNSREYYQGEDDSY